MRSIRPIRTPGLPNRCVPESTGSLFLPSQSSRREATRKLRCIIDPLHAKHCAGGIVFISVINSLRPKKVTIDFPILHLGKQSLSRVK